MNLASTEVAKSEGAADSFLNGKVMADTFRRDAVHSFLAA